MAMLKAIPTIYQIPAEYWRVAHANIDYNSNHAIVYVHGYLNEQARRNGADPIAIVVVTIGYAPQVARGASEYILLCQANFAG
ncbi:MAG: hypothetical protein D6735_13735 [Acidobacteria bacterium]|nr:MAG: hypothetical protein D6735_13735 [Acidobacteriota bacterium]